MQIRLLFTEMEIGYANRKYSPPNSENIKKKNTRELLISLYAMCFHGLDLLGFCGYKAILMG